MLAAMCRSPRRELRRLGSKALAALTWNGQVDSRIVGADVREQWRLWISVAIRRDEMIRLQCKLGSGKKLTSSISLQSHTDSSPTDRRNTERRREGGHKANFLLEKGNHVPPRNLTVARRQWALRRRRTCEGPNHANMRQLVTGSTPWLFPRPGITDSSSQYIQPTPLIRVLLVLAHDRDQDCVLAAVRGLAGVSFNTANASQLGETAGLVTALISLVKHANPEVVALACDVMHALQVYAYLPSGSLT